MTARSSLQSLGTSEVMITSVPPISFPIELWNDNVLYLPASLIEDYKSELTRIGRLNDASSEAPKGDIGGIDERSTHDHFTYKFPASSTRTEYMLLDPLRTFESLSSELLESFTDGRVSLLDIPCGAGAGVLGLLDLLRMLRSVNVLARLPLEVKITAGDVSPYARDLYGRMLTRAAPRLWDQGICVDWQCFEWDATQEPMTAALVDKWFAQGANNEEWIVLISAFSGDGKRPAELENGIGRSFDHIAARLHDRLGTLVWVEPVSNASEKWFKRIVRPLVDRFSAWFTQSDLKEQEYYWQHPFRDLRPCGRVRIMKHKKTLL